MTHAVDSACCPPPPGVQAQAHAFSLPDVDMLLSAMIRLKLKPGKALLSRLLDGALQLYTEVGRSVDRA